MKTVNEYINLFEEKKLKLQRVCELLVLRPNDMASFHGIERVNVMKEATETVLDTPEYRDSKLREYYYDMKNNPHRFNDFERWQVWGRN